MDLASLGGQRVLLVNPSIVDLRVPWSEWVEPTGLLQIGACLQTHSCDVRLLDCFRAKPEQRKLDAVLSRDDQRLNRWSFGLAPPQIFRSLRAMKSEGWEPDQILVTSLSSVWWRALPSLFDAIRTIFPSTPVILGGVYAAKAPKHAATLAAQWGVTLDADLHRGAANLPPATALYTHRVTHSAVASLPDVGAERAIAAIGEGYRRGITHYHLADHGIAARDPTTLDAFLESLAAVHKRSRLHVLGTISARDIIDWPELPALLRAARCTFVTLSDNRSYCVDDVDADRFLNETAEATEHLQAAGFTPRTDKCAAAISVGRPGERAGDAAALLTRLAGIIGSTVAIPYQPSAAELAVDDPWEANGKLFPLAERNGSAFSDYMAVLGLSAILNAKHRSRSFNFSGPSRIARSVRRSLAARAWDPAYGEEPELEPARRAPVALPMVEV